ncbi:unnamed protein product [Phytomonas sp. Hart1]|nr:unnamed protein product [Phytomonas sp. Hart1]|eukprot:CCW70202.1 unnamed protein product [Phytomonas sp. isolate Hart1]
MSSVYDSSGFSSRDDSIPLGENESDYLDDEGSLYTGTEEAEDSLGNVKRARRGDGRGAASSGVTGQSSQFYSGQTSYRTASDTISQPLPYESEDYSSGYGSLSYDYDSSDLRSGSASELSSTLLTFFNKNETIARVREMGYFFRRPILFFLFSVGGNGALAGFFRAMQVWTPRAASVGSKLSTEALSSLAEAEPRMLGYPNVPNWLREVRAALPAAVERPAAWVLRSRGVPILSELQEASRLAEDHLAKSLCDSAVSWKNAGQMIPIGIFLPIFTYFTLYIASNVIARRLGKRRLLLFDDDLSQVDAISGVESPNYSREYSALMYGSNLRLGFAKAEEGDDRPASVTTAPASMPQHPINEGVIDPSKEGSKSHLPKLDLPTKSMGPSLFSGIDLDGNLDGQEELPATTRPRGATLRPDKNAPPTSSPDAMGAALLPMNSTLPSRESSFPQNTPVFSLGGGLPTRGVVQLRGHQILLALIGTPSVIESNGVLVAALRYGMPAVLLPATMANESRLMEVPNTELQIEFAHDMLSCALDHAEKYSLEVIAIHQTKEFAPDATSLYTFSHPVRALYLFIPPSQEEAFAPVMAQASTTRIFVGTANHAQRRIPVNECLYDRLSKEQG